MTILSSPCSVNAHSTFSILSQCPFLLLDVLSKSILSFIVLAYPLCLASHYLHYYISIIGSCVHGSVTRNFPNLLSQIQSFPCSLSSHCIIPERSILSLPYNALSVSYFFMFVSIIFLPYDVNIHSLSFHILPSWQSHVFVTSILSIQYSGRVSSEDQNMFIPVDAFTA